MQKLKLDKKRFINKVDMNPVRRKLDITVAVICFILSAVCVAMIVINILPIFNILNINGISFDNLDQITKILIYCFMVINFFILVDFIKIGVLNCRNPVFQDGVYFIGNYTYRRHNVNCIINLAFFPMLGAFLGWFVGAIKIFMILYYIGFGLAGIGLIIKIISLFFKVERNSFTQINAQETGSDIEENVVESAVTDINNPSVEKEKATVLKGAVEKKDEISQVVTTNDEPTESNTIETPMEEKENITEEVNQINPDNVVDEDIDEEELTNVIEEISNTKSSISIQEKIEELKHLKDLGALTEEEYLNAIEKIVRDIS